MEVRKFLMILKRQIYYVFLLALLVVTGGCAIAKIDGPYVGKVIDAVTGQPIEGAVAHGDWYREYIGAGGISHAYADSAETLTDKNGEFNIPGLGFLMFTYIGEMNITIFKAGYEQITSSDWGPCSRGLIGCRNSSGPMTVKEDGNRITFKLRRLTEEERDKRRVNLGFAPSNKARLLRLEYNKEMKDLGYGSQFLLPVE